MNGYAARAALSTACQTRARCGRVESPKSTPESRPVSAVFVCPRASCGLQTHFSMGGVSASSDAPALCRRRNAPPASFMVGFQPELHTMTTHTLPAPVGTHGAQPAEAVTLSLINGQPCALSSDIAEHFNKQHRAVLLAIDNLAKNLPADRLHNFVQTVVLRENPSGGAPIETRAFHLTRDGFTLLAMGFTGKRALQFKLAYIDAFNQMEASLARPVPLPYKEQPGQSLSEEQCAELRDMLTGAATQVPSEMRRIFMVQGWSRLKAHFGCSYRQIPAERFDEATDLIARHVALYLPPAPEQAPAPQINLLDQRAMLHAFHAAQDWLTDVESFAGIDHEQKLPPDFPVINIGMTPEIIGLVSYALECAQFLLHWDASEGKFVIQQMHDREIVVDLDRLNAHAFAALVPESRLLEFLEAFLARKRKLESGEPHNG